MKWALKMLHCFPSPNGSALSKALTGFVAMIIILSLSVLIGIIIFSSVNTAYVLSYPRGYEEIRINVKCFLLTANGYLCLASNPLGYAINLRLYLANGSMFSSIIEPNTVAPIPCGEFKKCTLLSSKVIYGEATAVDNITTSNKIVVVIENR